MRFILLICLFNYLIISSGCDGKDTVVVVETPYKIALKGMDISFLPEIETYGSRFFDSSGVEMPLLDIIKRNGINLVRIRLWNNPADQHSGFDEVAELARRCRQKGFKIFLDLHYSDTWADPGHQEAPAVWKDLPLAELKDSVYQYTKFVLSSIRPEYVQIGNEINNGFMWNIGSLQNEKNFIDILKQGIRASREVNPETSIIIHYAGIEGSSEFYDLLEKNEVEYDIIGISYYPVWHGKSTKALENELNILKAKFNKEVFIAEFSYPFTLQYNDLTHNVVGLESQLINGFAPTKAGQKAFVNEIKSVCERSLALGFCYWGGEWIAFKGYNAGDGSSYENQALFDFNNKENPALSIFR